MEQILLSVSIFTVVVLILVLILNFAESQLLPQGDVTVEINGDSEKSIITRPGSTLLSALACLLYTSPSPRDQRGSRMPSSA